MVRSLWRRPVLGRVVQSLAWGLTLAGLALGADAPPRERILTVQEQGKPVQKCRVLKSWSDRDGNHLCQVQDVASGEVMTILEPPSAQPGKPILARIFHAGEGPVPGIPTPPQIPQAKVTEKPVASTPAPERKPLLLGWAFGAEAPKKAVASTEGPKKDSAPKKDAPQSKSAATKEVPDTTPVVKAETASAEVDDWRKSWGRVERWQNTESAVKKDGGASQPESKTTSKLPHAEVKGEDPLQHPEVWVSDALAGKSKASPATVAAAASASPRRLIPERKPAERKSAEIIPATPPPPPPPPMLPVKETARVPASAPPTPIPPAPVRETPPVPASAPLMLPPPPVKETPLAPTSAFLTPPPPPSIPGAGPLTLPPPPPQQASAVVPTAATQAPQATTPPAATQTAKTDATQPGTAAAKPSPPAKASSSWTLSKLFGWGKSAKTEKASDKILPASAPALQQTQFTPGSAPGAVAHATQATQSLSGGQAGQAGQAGTGVPTGMGSILAASMAQEELQRQPANVQLVAAPNAFSLQQQGNPAYATMPPPGYGYGGYPVPPGGYPPAGAYPPPGAYQPPVQTYVGSGMGNAFTTPSLTDRPVPADYGPPPEVPNGLSGPNANLRPPQQAGGPVPGMGMMPGAGMPQPATSAPAAQEPASGETGGGPQAGQGVEAAGLIAQPTIPQAMQVLKEALFPSQREGAAEFLSKCNWRTQPEVPLALQTAATADPAPTVRRACVRALSHLKVNTLPVLQTLQALEADGDPQVRREAKAAVLFLMAQ